MYTKTEKPKRARRQRAGLVILGVTLGALAIMATPALRLRSQDL